MDQETLSTVDASLQRCSRDPRFLDLFYEKFLASSPKVREKFAHTDFVRQKRALRSSLWMMLLVAEDEEKGPARYLRGLTAIHGSSGLDIGAELYDLAADPGERHDLWMERQEEGRALKARYYGEITYIDDCVGRVLDAVLKRRRVR